MPYKKQDPPDDVVFSDQVALIPSLGVIFDRPLWVHNPDPIYFQDRPRMKVGSWVDRGDPIISFKVSKHADRGFLYRLAIETIRNPSFITIYSPVSGLVVDTGDAIVGGINEESGNFMLAVLLPKNTSVPETAESGFTKFCNFCSTYRESIFHNRMLVGESGLQKVMEVWSDQKIDKVLTDLRASKIPVKPVSSSSYKERIAELKQRYPANFTQNH